jgi:hypothetical protein
MSGALFEKFGDEDREFLNSIGASLFEGPGLIYAVVPDVELGEPYTPTSAKVMFQIPFGYPDAGLDMFWTLPHVKLAGTGTDPLQASHCEQHMGETWQRWSRHCNWRSGVDNLRTFWRAVQIELGRGR